MDHVQTISVPALSAEVRIRRKQELEAKLLHKQAEMISLSRQIVALQNQISTL